MEIEKMRMDLGSAAENITSLIEGNINIASKTKLQDLNILLVDDDSFTLDVVTSSLYQLGITNVESTDSALQALEFVKEQGHFIDVLLCDLNMPGMNGIEFFSELASTDYKGNIAIITGASNTTISMAELLADIDGIQVLGTLKKPATREELSILLSEAL